MKTKLINLFGGPGAGKTTTAYNLAGRLKAMGSVALYVPEYATDLAYDGTLQNTPQAAILIEQFQRILRGFGTADFIITDSPVFMQLAYAPKDIAQRVLVASEAFRRHEQNFFIENERETHEARGRVHNKEQAKELDGSIKGWLKAYDIPFTCVRKEDAVMEILTNLR